MSGKAYQILIIEDDFRVADINREFIQQAPSFEVLAMARSGQEARDMLAQQGDQIDLVLLDAYLPDVVGLELLWHIRQHYKQIDVVMITAAKEVETIQEALRGGVFDYLIKPTQSDRMHQMLKRFKQERTLLQSQSELSQQELDAALKRSASIAINDSPRLPKGIDKLTLDAVTEKLSQTPVAITAMTLAEGMGASRSTARRYLEYLVAQGQVKAELVYGEVGRPERRYQWR
ncbi:MAG: response regulator [Saccharospirillum sp.]|nr:response regulator [Saccharospirillum sp.]